MWLNATVNKLLNAHDILVSTLKDEITQLHAEIEHRRKREEALIDEILKLKGAGPISQPEKVERDDTVMERLRKHREMLAHIGGEVESNGETQ